MKHTRINPVNRERRKRRKDAGEVYGPYFGYVSKLPCLLAGYEHTINRWPTTCLGLNTAHHLKSVGAGGKDAANLIPLCQFAHLELHTIGAKSFEAKYGVDLRAIAARLAEEYPNE